MWELEELLNNRAAGARTQQLHAALHELWLSWHGAVWEGAAAARAGGTASRGAAAAGKLYVGSMAASRQALVGCSGMHGAWKCLISMLQNDAPHCRMRTRRVRLIVALEHQGCPSLMPSQWHIPLNLSAPLVAGSPLSVVDPRPKHAFIGSTCALSAHASTHTHVPLSVARASCRHMHPHIHTCLYR